MSNPRRAGRVGRVLAAASVAALALSPAAVPAQAADVPSPPPVVTSPNMTHVANPPMPAQLNGLGINTDMAFQGDYAFVGHYGGFTVYDIKNPEKPQVASVVRCPGEQGDISVYDNLLFLSVEAAWSDESCSAEARELTEKDTWRGIRVFDISDPRSPRYIKAIKTDCGSHTHTLLPDKQKRNVYLYVSSSFVHDLIPDCQPPHDKISIVKVPLSEPTAASVVATPVLFPDGGNQDGPMKTNGCHDFTVYPEKDIAAGACEGDGVLLDISDPEQPKVTARLTDPNYFYWHSATFNRDATKVVFVDELGGGAAACTEAIGPNLGADAIYDISDPAKPVFKSYFKIPRHQGEDENCAPHNGALIPVKGRDIMVQAWYQGGISVWDFTDSSHPAEIGYFDRGSKPGQFGGHWSGYYYNGYVYGSDTRWGLDVIKVNDERVQGADQVRLDRLNPQTQVDYLAGGQR